MIEKILEKVPDAMTPHLNDEQIEKLNNVLYINRNCKEFAFESENFAQKNERSLSEVLIGVYKRPWLQKF